MRADKVRKGLLYAGTEYGMYISYDDGANWKKFQQNLPIVPITDLAIKENDLIVATQGRAFWTLDDLSIVQQKDTAITSKNWHVFTVNDAYRSEGGGRRGNRGAGAPQPNMGENPPSGVVFNYFLREGIDTANLKITIYDKKNQPIKTFSKSAKEANDKIDYAAGMNQFIWDMNYPPGEKTEGMILWNGGIGSAKAAPGKYQAKFTMGKDSVWVPFVIKANPNYAITEADYDAQLAFLLQVRDKFNQVQISIKDIRTVRGQITDFTSRLEGENTKEIKKMADSIQKQLTSIEEALYQTKSKSGQDVLNFPIRINDKLAGLYGVAASGQNAPSKQAREAFADLAGQADVQIDKLKKVITTDVASLNKMINEKQLPVIGIKKQ
jgi:hypothetical protein